MLSNYLKTTLRSLQKQKFYALINLLGLAVGMTASLMILLYVANDLSYDRFHRHIDQIHLIGLHGKLGDQDLHTANTCAPMMGALVTEYPEVVSATQTAIWKTWYCNTKHDPSRCPMWHFRTAIFSKYLIFN